MRQRRQKEIENEDEDVAADRLDAKDGPSETTDDVRMKACARMLKR